MNVAWQDVATVLLIAVAAGYLARRLWRIAAGRQSGACGTCKECSKSDNELVQIDPQNGRRTRAS